MRALAISRNRPDEALNELHVFGFVLTAAKLGGHAFPGKQAPTTHR